jgi:LysR family glycine cleavage system transcriptional activator
MTAHIPRRLLPSNSLLQAFEATVRCGSITGAARELSLTQSAVSRQIMTLEGLLEVPLFIREKQTIRITLAGESYVREVREALRRIGVASLNIRANPVGGTLNLGALPAFASRWLIRRLPRFAAQYPNIMLNLITRSAPFDFNTDTLDAAIHFGKSQWPGANLAFVMNEEIIPACSPAMAQKFSFDGPQSARLAPLLILMSRPDQWEQ